LTSANRTAVFKGTGRPGFSDVTVVADLDLAEAEAAGEAAPQGSHEYSRIPHATALKGGAGVMPAQRSEHVIIGN
jgi:hypothetical protein